MGGGERRALTQWSQGEYSGAAVAGTSVIESPQDDLAAISSVLGYRPDDHGDLLTAASATPLTFNGNNATATGIIERSSSTTNDVDVFRIDITPDQVGTIVRVDPPEGVIDTFYGNFVGVGNLDVELRVFDANDTATPLAIRNPIDETNASYTFTAAGSYYLQVDGVGKGDPAGTGYSDYGSLGQYTVTARKLVGDFSGDGKVDAADYDLWANEDPAADVDGNGFVDYEDFKLWQADYGFTNQDVIPGDFNRDLIVDAADRAIWDNNDLRADADRNGQIEQADLDIWYANRGLRRLDHTSEPRLQVADVIVSSTVVGGNDPDHSYAVEIADAPGTGRQLVRAAVGGANTISVRFTEDVNPATLQDALSLYGTTTANVPTLVSGGFSYDPATFTASWTFSGWSLIDFYSIKLDAAAVTAATGGHQLDGEWVNPINKDVVNDDVSDFVVLGSGDGEAGGDFVFVATLLPGDANGNNVVDLVDLNILGQNFDPNHLGGASLEDADFNGDGKVDLVDLNILGQNFYSPGGDPGKLLLMGDILLDANLDNDQYSVDALDEALFLAGSAGSDFDGDGITGLADQEDTDFFYAWLGFRGVA